MNREKLRRLSSIIQAMARFFWFTIEFGLMSSPKGLKVYGSGLLSSHGEISPLCRTLRKFSTSPSNSNGS